MCLATPCRPSIQTHEPIGIIPIQITIATFIPSLMILQVTELWYLSERRNYIPGEWGGWHRPENRTHTHLASPPPRDIEVSVLAVLDLAISALMYIIEWYCAKCGAQEPSKPL